MSLAWLGSVAGDLLGKWASSAMDAHYSGKLIEKQLAAQKDLFEFENSNKHQFEVSDLKAAGLNPILSAMNPSAIGVGGVSAPNWTSDDDIYGPAAARALQKEQISVQDQMAKSSMLNAEAGLLKAKSESKLADEKAETERQLRDYNIKKIISETIRNTSDGKQMRANVDRIVSEIPVNLERARNIAEDTTHRRLSNEQMFEVQEILKNPKYDKEGFKAALAYALATGKNWTDALAFAVSKSAVDKRQDAVEKINNMSWSAHSVDDTGYSYFGERGD